MFENEYIQNILIMVGVPEIVFDKGIDAESLLWSFIFSTELLIFILSIVIWSVTLMARMYSTGTVSNPNKHVRRNEALVHSYDGKDMKLKYKDERSENIISIIIKGFIFPVLVIFSAIMIGLKMMEFHG
tara:strand:- start:889 stop:1275 length:387 start_codon:yes stop_codon:yes gene_type:complete